MRAKLKDPERAAATAARKEENARQAALAMQDYRAHAAAIRANMERLRAQRLVMEAKSPADTQKPQKKKCS
jgi:hypothetical protein